MTKAKIKGKPLSDVALQSLATITVGDVRKALREADTSLKPFLHAPVRK